MSLASKLERGLAMHQQGQFDLAEVLYREILLQQPRHFDALQLLATIALQRGNAQEAVDLFDRALTIKPDSVNALNNRGNALRDLTRLEDALVSYDMALKVKPHSAELLNNRGAVLRDLQRFDEALACYEVATTARPDYAEAFYNRGVMQRQLKRHLQALESFEHALAIDPGHAEALNGRANTLLDLKRLEEAQEAYGRLLKLKPDCEFIHGTWLHTQLKICDWLDAERLISEMERCVEQGDPVSPPFPFLALSNNPVLHKKVAERWTSKKTLVSQPLPPLVKYPRHDKIRIGYFSADFHNHPGSYLMAGLFEAHDREQFEIIAFSFGPLTGDEMQKRVSAAFDRFIDVRAMSDKEVALLARRMEIDIAIDRKGYTQDSRPGIFALRAAPIQASYLAYPGTLGGDFIDYLIADPIVIPEADREHYSEKIAYLPNCYQVNDVKREIADKHDSRAELGLPEAGFVFCCFNNNHKILPKTFDSWMRVLKQVPGSVLWLFEDNPTAGINLRKEAERRGVNGARLIFATRMPLAEHLARHRAADLFLDTLPYNAHTTASDALWAGLPVLTLLGQTFAGRVAASLLNAIGLPELITRTAEEFEALAIELATNPVKLAGIKQKLADNRLTTPLFDCQGFTRDLECLFAEMYRRYQANLAPDDLVVVLPQSI